MKEICANSIEVTTSFGPPEKKSNKNNIRRKFFQAALFIGVIGTTAWGVNRLYEAWYHDNQKDMMTPVDNLHDRYDTLSLPIHMKSTTENLL